MSLVSSRSIDLMKVPFGVIIVDIKCQATSYHILQRKQQERSNTNLKSRNENMVSYNVRKLISLPSSGGMTPENWFASSILFQIFVINTQDY